MVACQVSYSMFRTPRKIARVRSAAYVNEKSLFADEHMPVDVFINPEQVVTDHVRLLLEHPGAQLVLDFADGKVQLVAVRAYAGSPSGGPRAARIVRKQLPNVNTRVAAIFRAMRAGACSTGGHEDGGGRRSVLHRRRWATSIRSWRNCAMWKAGLQAGYHRRRGQHRRASGHRHRTLSSTSRSSKSTQSGAEQLATALKAARWCCGAMRPTRINCATRGGQLRRVLRPHQRRRSEHHVVADGEALRRKRRVMTLINKPAYVDLIQHQRNRRRHLAAAIHHLEPAHSGAAAAMWRGCIGLARGARRRLWRRWPAAMQRARKHRGTPGQGA